MITVKRIYDPAASGDGYRVLVDRLWPRGISREAAALDLWAKAIAPSTELRQWYAHAPERWQEFQQRYRLELSVPAAVTVLDELRLTSQRCAVTLLTATRNETQNHANFLSELLRAPER